MIATDEFESLVRLESRARGLADLPYAVTKHPIGGLRPEVVVAKAGAMVPAVVSAVTAPTTGE
ncbi:MAG: hypothetical protein C4290_00955 [Chloroflexota bacterium]